jgi:hypothetical protein
VIEEVKREKNRTDRKRVCEWINRFMEAEAEREVCALIAKPEVKGRKKKTTKLKIEENVNSNRCQINRKDRNQTILRRHSEIRE